MDLYVSAVRGRLPESYGKEKIDKHLTIFIILTNFLLQQQKPSTQNHNYERFCNSHGVKIKEYIANNNPFHSADWKEDCKNQLQEFQYSGVGAH